ncbi:MAG TPA: hypothetical protein VEM95_04345 [Thermoplasmata archaeon]|nr:hypothetical protein [Thermoplasmata archaeon]
MSQALREVRLGSKTVWALFDSGASRSYVVRRVIPRGTPKGRDPTARRVRLGGRERRIQDWRALIAEADECSFSFKAYALDAIGPGEGRPIELIVGAPVMEEFEIALRPSRGRLVPDLSGLRRGTCVDFAS